MKQTIEISAKTVDEALKKGAAQLGVAVSELEYLVIKEPKKGFLGFGEAPATVRISYEPDEAQAAVDFVRNLLADLGIEAETVVSPKEDGKLISIEGENVGLLIGHHGETLDAVQYLANLAANRREDGDKAYTRITVDVENYRAKREDTLRRLANRMAQKALRYHKSVTLEPMNPYERRIIHSELQNVEGVTTTSIGVDSNRRVVIYPEGESINCGEEKGNGRRRRHGSGERRSAFDIFEEPAPVEETEDVEEAEEEPADEEEAEEASEN